MQRKLRYWAVLLLVLSALTFIGCSLDGGSPPAPFDSADTAGQQTTVTAAGVSFKMVYVPGGLTFPTGTNDEGTATVTEAYWIGETEVPYELWQTVYDWATIGTGASGAGQYSFANTGRQGGDLNSGPVGTNQHPVTGVNWRDSMVWCNALTEWYNAQKGTSYECVYTYDDGGGPEIIRDSQDTNGSSCDGATVGSAAKGFRLLTMDEYECAARYRDGTIWSYGDHASGDDSGACYDDGDILGGMGMSTVFGNYAVYQDNSSSTAAVKSLGDESINALGLFDLSGNVWEWCFDLIRSNRVYRGGSWRAPAVNLQVGYFNGDSSYNESNYVGFRIAKTQ